ncbi:MAG: tRNA (N6-threonylcarbamoyladenosine(37)-N6)-methyltransferase TrmO [Candidatus Ozemobacteraceae bacterium]
MSTVPAKADKPGVATFRPIGVVHTPFETPVGMPIQPCGAEGVAGEIEIYPEFAEGLKDLEGFSHLWLIYWLHEVKSASLIVKPFLDTVEHGIFATRSPKRPNAIGLSVVRLKRVDGNRIAVENVDVLNGTPLLDIKPYVPAFDQVPATRIGWFAGKAGQAVQVRSDARFAESSDHDEMHKVEKSS